MLVIGLSVLGLAASAGAQDIATDPVSRVKKSGEVAKQSAFRGSTILYENAFSPYQYAMQDPDYNPQYVMAWSFQPRYYVRDDLSLRARLDVIVELTQSDDMDSAHEPVISDLMFELAYAPSWAEIPLLGIKVSGGLRLAFPTSQASQAQSLVMYLAPGLAFSRSFELMKGDLLSSLSLGYIFRGYKYFHQYVNPQIDTGSSLAAADPEEPIGTLRELSRRDRHGGSTNREWRFINGLTASLSVYKGLSLTAAFMLSNQLSYDYEARETSNPNDGSVQQFPASGRHLVGGYLTSIDLNYPVLDWLLLTAGVNWNVPMLNADSSGYRHPFEGRYTMVYLDAVIPVAKLVDQVQAWVE